MWSHSSHHYAVVTPLRKATSYEPRIAILGIWGDTWLTRGKYSIYVAVTGPLRGLCDAFWKVERNFKMFKILPRKISPIYCRVSYVAVRIPSLVLRNTWHYVIIWRWKFWFPKFVLTLLIHEAALHKDVTTALQGCWGLYRVGHFFPFSTELFFSSEPEQFCCFKLQKQWTCTKNYSRLNVLRCLSTHTHTCKITSYKNWFMFYFGHFYISHFSQRVAA